MAAYQVSTGSTAFVYSVEYCNAGSSATTMAYCYAQQQTVSAGLSAADWGVANQRAAVEAARRAAREAQALADEADKLAEALLLAHLTAEQAAQYRRVRSFDVAMPPSARRPARVYQITFGWAGNVYLLDGTGRFAAKYCIHPTEAVPYADNMLAQKLMLEADEEEFLRVANRTLLPGAARRTR